MDSKVLSRSLRSSFSRFNCSIVSCLSLKFSRRFSISDFSSMELSTALTFASWASSAAQCRLLSSSSFCTFCKLPSLSSSCAFKCCKLPISLSFSHNIFESSSTLLDLSLTLAPSSTPNDFSFKFNSLFSFWSFSKISSLDLNVSLKFSSSGKSFGKPFSWVDDDCFFRVAISAWSFWFVAFNSSKASCFAFNSSVCASPDTPLLWSLRSSLVLRSWFSLLMSSRIDCFICKFSFISSTCLLSSLMTDAPDWSCSSNSTLPFKSAFSRLICFNAAFLAANSSSSSCVLFFSSFLSMLAMS